MRKELFLVAALGLGVIIAEWLPAPTGTVAVEEIVIDAVSAWCRMPTGDLRAAASPSSSHLG